MNSPVKVLIVDDDPSMRRMLRAALEHGGDMIIAGEAQDGFEGVSLAGALRPDVILLDLNMPRMDGVRAASLIRDQFPGARIIVWSVQCQDQLRQAAFNNGVWGYLVKGETSIIDLVRTVRAAAEGDHEPPMQCGWVNYWMRRLGVQHYPKEGVH